MRCLLLHEGQLVAVSRRGRCPPNESRKRGAKPHPDTAPMPRACLIWRYLTIALDCGLRGRAASSASIVDLQTTDAKIESRNMKKALSLRDVELLD